MGFTLRFIKNHIAYRFLTDENLVFEILESTHSDEWRTLMNVTDKPEISNKVLSTYNLVSAKNQTPYLVTESVLKYLSLLKVHKKGNHFGWTVFKHLKNQKITFILPGNVVVRFLIQGDIMHIFHLGFKFTTKTKEKGEGHMQWVMYWLNKNTGELCEHFEHTDVIALEETMYKFLCFFYLTENQEEIVQAGKIYGTRKTGKIANDFKFPVTVVNSKWNITSIRNEDFDVSGHFRLQPCGPNNSETKIIFIEPFKKFGYTRSAKQ